MNELERENSLPELEWNENTIWCVRRDGRASVCHLLRIELKQRTGKKPPPLYKSSKEPKVVFHGGPETREDR